MAHHNLQPVTLWFTGLSGAGKTTIAEALQGAYRDLGMPAQLLDGDVLRAGLNRDLGFSPEDRRENIRRVAEVAKLFNGAGLFVSVAAISPLQADRDAARAIVGPARFLEIYVDTPLPVCEERDVKGLYRRARAGLLPNFTGISAPYEPPALPDLVVSGNGCELGHTVSRLLNLVLDRSALRLAASSSQSETESFFYAR